MSEMFSPCKSRYSHYEKIMYDVFMLAHQLRHYFQAKQITIMSHMPLCDIINNRDATLQVAKWEI